MLLRRTLVSAAFILSACLLDASVAWRRVESSPSGVLPTPLPDVEPTASLAVDVNGDGIAELIVGGRNSGPALTLWRFEGGRWTTEVIEPDDVRIEAGGAAFDIDGDGDLDLVFGGDGRSGEIWWWENPHPNRGRWTRRVIKRDANMQHHDQIFGDFDGDGKTELVSWNQRARSLLRFQIPANPKTDALWPVETIFTRTEGQPQEGLAAADIDGDGVMDIVGGGYWYKHVGGGRFAANLIDPAMAFTRVAAGQLVKGGRPEVVFVPGDLDGPLNWYQWENNRWVANTLDPNVIHGHSLEIADIDGDGNLDIFVAEMGTWSGRVNNPTARVLIFYGDGAGNFRRQVVSMGQGVHECRLADLNGNGRLDIFGKPFRHNAPRLVLWMNEGPVKTPLALNKWERHLIDDTAPGKRLFIEAIDLDGDGHRDLVSGGWWHRNPGRIGAKWEKRAIGGAFKNFATAYDFDRDGAFDLIGTTGEFHGNQFIVAFNDGRGNFTLRTDIPAGTGDFLQGVTAARLQNNVNSVVLSWHKNQSGLEALVFPDDARRGPWQLKVLSPFSRFEQVTVGDIDRDGNADLLLGDYWLRNTGTDWSVHEIGQVTDLSPRAEADRNRLVDLNGNGWLDAVVSLENGTHIMWFENPGKDPTGPWKRHIIGEAPGQGFSMDVADFDGDGDFDIVVGEHRGPLSTNRVLIFENVDGRGGIWRTHVIDQGPADVIDHHDGTIAVDLDGDGDIDIISIGFRNNKVWVLENKAIDRAPAPAVGTTAQQAR
jgi:hypothetical protein